MEAKEKETVHPSLTILNLYTSDKRTCLFYGKTLRRAKEGSGEWHEEQKRKETDDLYPSIHMEGGNYGRYRHI